MLRTTIILGVVMLFFGGLRLTGQETFVSLVDYLAGKGQPSDFNSRANLFRTHTSVFEKYEGTADQNTRLLFDILRVTQEMVIPLASGKIERCEQFYGNPNISRYLTQAFAQNVIKACIVTGTSVLSSKIRIELQKIYSVSKPADGTTFTSEEHKKMHDQAYAAAGCIEGSANIMGWIIMNVQEWPSSLVQLSILRFGQCTVRSSPTIVSPPSNMKVNISLP